MAIAKFSSTTETHNALSKLLSEVKEHQALVFITHHGKPKYALLPLETISEDVLSPQIIGIRELSKEFSKYLKALAEKEVFYIVSRKQPVAQLVSIEPDDVDDMIVTYNQPLQSEAEHFSNPETVDALTPTKALLNEFKALRAKKLASN
jgi:antitoxin (DNA-binding transcriptional repressor) of toxin-antitoxin stability system